MKKELVNSDEEYIIVAAMFKIPILNNIKNKLPTFSYLFEQIEKYDVYAHNFWCLKNINTNKVVAQLHGLAANRQNLLDKKAVGGFNDTLRAWHCVYDDTFATQYGFNKDNFSLPIDADFAYQVRGSDSVEKWLRAVQAIDMINNLNLDYPPFGFLGKDIINSNSIYHTFADIMQLEMHTFQDFKAIGIENSLFNRIKNQLSSLSNNNSYTPKSILS